MGKYDDIINLPHHVSQKHPSMNTMDRAAQFAPFAALTGHKEAIRETARLTDKKIELDSNAKEELDYKLSVLQGLFDEKPSVSILYFQKDPMKDGGEYLEIKGTLRRIEPYENKLILEDRREVKIDDILDIEF